MPILSGLTVAVAALCATVGFVLALKSRDLRIAALSAPSAGLALLIASVASDGGAPHLPAPALVCVSLSILLATAGIWSLSRIGRCSEMASIEHSGDGSPVEPGSGEDASEAVDTENLCAHLLRPSPSDVPAPRFVLVVDDQEIVLATTRALLEARGYAVLTASDGLRALEILEERAECIGAVILDVSMPILSGWEVLTRIRERWSTVPVIMSSGYPEPEPTGSWEEYGQRSFLQKPYASRELFAALDQAIRAEQGVLAGRPRS